MPRYFLHLHDAGDLIEDPEGRNYDDVEAAVAEAEASAREMLAESVRTGEEIDGQYIEVVDDTGRTLATVRFRDQLNFAAETGY